MIKTNSLLKRGLKKLWTSKSGGVLIYLAFGLPMLLGAMALSVDLGRAFILNTELKDFSDAAALAGAAELDGRPGARLAAETAARSGISGTLLNVQAFATDGGGPGITIKSNADLANPGIVFLRTLPADGTDFTVADTALGDADARFIFVSVVNRNVRSGLSRALGIIPDFTSEARSIAGFTSVTCRVPPIFMCNPLEADGTDGYALFPVPINAGCDADIHLGRGVPLTEDCLIGRQMIAKAVGPQSTYFPGNFGLLDATNCKGNGTNGGRCIAEGLATLSPEFCVIDTVDTATGAKVGPIRTGLNVRFDIYKSFLSNKKSDPLYPPAMNVTKGDSNTSDCNISVTAPAVKFPRDACFATDTCSGGRFGNGNWHDLSDLDNDPNTPDTNPYWSTNHPNIDPPTAANGPFNKNYEDMSRYEVYRHEIVTGNIPNTAIEDGRPQCYSGITPSPDPTYDNDAVGIDETDRRVIIMAAVNCRQYDFEHPGDELRGNTDDVPTVGFVKIFMTESIDQPGGAGDNGTDLDIYVELAGVLEPEETDALRDIVQLYR